MRTRTLLSVLSVATGSLSFHASSFPVISTAVSFIADVQQAAALSAFPIYPPLWRTTNRSASGLLPSELTECGRAHRGSFGGHEPSRRPPLYTVSPAKSGLLLNWQRNRMYRVLFLQIALRRPLACRRCAMQRSFVCVSPVSGSARISYRSTR